jgi:hypothetical protein
VIKNCLGYGDKTVTYKNPRLLFEELLMSFEHPYMAGLV